MLRASVGLEAERDRPRGEGDVEKWFVTDGACADYLEWLRWPAWFVCPACGVPGGDRLADGCVWCDSADGGWVSRRTRSSATRGLRSRSGSWRRGRWRSCRPAGRHERCTACSVGAYQTAWAIRHRDRHAISASRLDRLEGVAEVDDSYFGGGHKAGRPDRSRQRASTRFSLPRNARIPKGSVESVTATSSRRPAP